MADKPKAERMAAWAKANPTLAKKNPPAPAKPAAPKADSSQMRAMSKPSTPSKPAKPQIKSDRLRKALASVKPVSKPTPGAKAAMKATNLYNSVDVSDFDVILEHLVDQGFPVEEALKLMVDISFTFLD